MGRGLRKGPGMRDPRGSLEGRGRREGDLQPSSGPRGKPGTPESAIQWGLGRGWKGIIKVA